MNYPKKRQKRCGLMWQSIVHGEIDEGTVQLVTPDELERRVQARLK